MPELLLELFSEEIPARMQGGATRDLARMASERLKAQELAFTRLETFVTPRRLTLVVDGLPSAQADRTEERKGPKANAPEQALQGFLRSTGLTRDQLVERDGVLFAQIARTGRPTPEIVAEIVGEICANFPWPKSMRSGVSSFRWVRPLRSVILLFDGQVVPFEVGGIKAGMATRGHRFMGGLEGDSFDVAGFDDYRTELAQQGVTLDAAERRRVILERGQAVAAAEGLELVPDDGLADEVAGLVEHPVPLLGAMDPAFLDLPSEVIRTSMRTHQKYFAVRDPGPESGTGKLAPRFVVVANIAASDGGAEIARGNAKVLSARLSDARFFWDEDRKPGAIEGWLEKLKGVTFHAKLGTMAERVERIAALAREIAPLVGADGDEAATAARLAKADLASAMVGEFPELQGVMGGYYVRAAGRSDAIADAVRDHYKPVGPSDSVPTAPVTVAVALADKLDTLVGFFAVDEKPTGSKDPQALRRAALGFIRGVLSNRSRLALRKVIYARAAAQRQREAERIGAEVRANAVEEYRQAKLAEAHLAGVRDGSHSNTIGFASIADVSVPADVLTAARNLGETFARQYGGMQWRNDIHPRLEELVAFFADRLKVQLREEGKRHDLVDAVFALGDDDLVRIVDKVEALSAFLATEDGANLLAGYRRAVNILKAEEKKNPNEVILAHSPMGPGQVQEAEEQALAETLDSVARAMTPLLEREDFTAAMAQLARLRAPVDAFFDRVLVNDPDPNIRGQRLRLLRTIKETANQVADFSLIQG